METGKLFDEYFRKFRDVEKILELMGMGDSDNGGEQLAFDVRSYCLVHRLFAEELKAEPDILAMALKLFRFPPLMPCFRERMRGSLAIEWSDIWTEHLMRIKQVFYGETAVGSDESEVFLWYLIGIAYDWWDWMKGLEDHFVRITAKEGFTRFAAFMRECCKGMITGEEIMRQYREEGFTPEFACYRSLKEMLAEVGMSGEESEKPI